MPRAPKRKHGGGRAYLGVDGHTVVVPVRFSARQVAAIKAEVARENAEIEADPGAAAADKRPATVSSWIRDHALEPLGLATYEP